MSPRRRNDSSTTRFNLNHRTLHLVFTHINPPLTTPRRTSLAPASNDRSSRRLPPRLITDSRRCQTNTALLPMAPISPSSHHTNIKTPPLPLPPPLLPPRAQLGTQSMDRVRDRILRSILRVKASRRHIHTIPPLFLPRHRLGLILQLPAPYTTIPIPLRPCLRQPTSTIMRILH
jgi:hypothetical protein